LLSCDNPSYGPSRMRRLDVAESWMHGGHVECQAATNVGLRFFLFGASV
jgi:hypothetical protein